MTEIGVVFMRFPYVDCGLERGSYFVGVSEEEIRKDVANFTESVRRNYKPGGTVVDHDEVEALGLQYFKEGIKAVREGIKSYFLGFSR